MYVNAKNNTWPIDQLPHRFGDLQPLPVAFGVGLVRAKTNGMDILDKLGCQLAVRPDVECSESASKDAPLIGKPHLGPVVKIDADLVVPQEKRSHVHLKDEKIAYTLSLRFL